MCFLTKWATESYNTKPQEDSEVIDLSWSIWVTGYFVWISCPLEA